MITSIPNTVIAIVINSTTTTTTNNNIFVRLSCGKKNSKYYDLQQQSLSHIVSIIFDF